MKFFIPLFTFVFFCNKNFAQQPAFKNTDRVYVLSIGLLNLRDSASATSLILAKLNLGDTAYIVETTKINCTPVNVFVKDTAVVNDSTYNENPIAQTLTLNGQWVKIIYKNFVGYVNGIYLSSLPNFVALEKKYNNLFTKEKVNMDALSNMHFYLLNKHYGLQKNAVQLSKAALQYKKKFNKKDDITEISYNTKYADGLLFRYEDGYMDTGVGGYTITITKKNVTLAEAIMYGRTFFYVGDNFKLGNVKIGYFFSKETYRYTITNYGEGGGCTAEIYKNKKGEWVVSFGCGGC